MIDFVHLPTLPRPPRLPETPPKLWPVFSGRVRSLAVTARLGRLLGICFTVCFLTGLYSHYQYHPSSWAPIPAVPAWGYRVTQGIHVCTGIASIPLLLAKLWSVYPKLFSWPPFGTVLQGLERLSIAVLVSTSLLELFTGFLNVLNWYAWPWGFVAVHYWLAFVIVGSLMLHIAVKLEKIKQGLAEPLTTPEAPEPGTGPTDGIDAAATTTGHTGGLTRRGALITAGAGVGVVAITTMGQSFTPLEPLAILAPRRPSRGPQQVPINRTATYAKVLVSARSADYRLEVKGPKPLILDLAALEALPTEEHEFPLACVEGWSVSAHWRGPMLYDIVRMAGGNAGSKVHVRSLQTGAPDTESDIFGPQMRNAVLATHLNGDRLGIDHGYPVRLIAPDRAGALNTKWLHIIEVTA